ncbi:MAG: hypothetical protein RLZ98_1654 [Pseudomonadota bacterium]|jgi:glycine cleavage system regulatory protein
MALEIVLTIVARDRPGLVKRVSEAVSANGGNWVDSSMARLGGEFAGIVRITLPEEKAAALEKALAGLAAEEIAVTVRRGAGGVVPSGTRATLVLTGIDHPGIVHRVASELAERNVSIDVLETEVFTGSMSGEAMFSARATVVLPTGFDELELRRALERLAQDIMVDIELSDEGK